MKTITICGTFALILSAALFAQDSASNAPGQDIAGPVEARLHEHLKSSLKNPADIPGLPRVLLIGDSISIGYTVPVRLYLQDKANVHRPPENCQHTGYGLTKLPEWLGTGKWDVIHFNWGIWDTHYLDKKTGKLVRAEKTTPPEEMRIRYTLEQYRENLTKLVNILKGTGARLVWASTTPIMFRKGERFEDISKYNEVAEGVMKENKIEVDDLYSYTLPETAKWQSPDQCHFNELGNLKLGEKVGQSILDALTRGSQAAGPK